MEIPPLARKLEEKGVRLERPRWYSFVVESYQPASPVEVERRLKAGSELRAVIPGVDVPLPVNSPQDLEELAHFQAAEPSPRLGEVADNLTRLAGQGWQFKDEEGRAIGLYGAYNAVTDPAFELKVTARKDERAIPLDTAERANGLAAFYVLNPNEEASCEEAGYHFFNENGAVEPVFLLGDGGQVGREEPWMPRGSETKKRLEKFEQLKARLDGDLQLARAVSEHPLLDRQAVEQLLKNRAPEQQEKLLPVTTEGLTRDELLALDTTATRQLLEALGSTSSTASGFRRWGGEPTLALTAVRKNPDATGADLCKLATEGIPWTDHAAQGRHLAEFSHFPLAGVAGRILKEVTSDESRWAAWKAFAVDPEGTDVAVYGKRIYQLLAKLSIKDKDQLGRALLHELPPSKLGDLPGERNFDLEARASLANPNATLGELAADSIPWRNREAHKAILDRLKQAPSTRAKAVLADRLYDHLDDPITRWAVWKACVQNPTGTDLKELGEQARELARSQSYNGKKGDLAKLNRFLTRELAGQGTGKRALEALERWGVGDTDLAAEGLSRHADDELGVLAASAIGWTDVKVQRKAMAEVAAPEARRVFEAVQTAEVRWAVFQAGALNPTADPQKLATEIYARLDTLKSRTWETKSEDLARLGRAILGEFQNTPEGQALQRWGVDNPDMAARALARGTSSLGELATESIAWTDEKAHRAVLTELKATRALEIHDQLQTREFQWAVWKAAVLNPEGAKLAEDTLAILDTLKNRSFEGKNEDWARLCAAFKRDVPAGAALERWGVPNTELALRGLVENRDCPTPAALGKLAAETIAWTNQEAHRKVLQELAGEKRTRFLAGTAHRLHEAVTAPETRWAVWKAAVLEPESTDLGAYRKRISELLGDLSYRGQSEDLSLLFDTLLAEEEVHRLYDGLNASSEGIAVEKERVVVGGVVLRNRGGADPPGR